MRFAFSRYAFEFWNTLSLICSNEIFRTDAILNTTLPTRTGLPLLVIKELKGVGASVSPRIRSGLQVWSNRLSRFEKSNEGPNEQYMPFSLIFNNSLSVPANQ